MSDPNSELINSALQGDRASLEELVRRNYRNIFAFLHGLAGNDFDAADLTQKTFSRFCESLSKFVGRSTLSTWLHGIAYHVYLEWRRKEPRVDHPLESWWVNCVDQGKSPGLQAEEADLNNQLFAAVESLDEEIRAVFHMHYYQHLSLMETAQALNVSVSTVKNRIRQGVEILKRQLNQASTLKKMNQ